MRFFYLAGFAAGSAIRAVARPSALARENEALIAERDRLIVQAERLIVTNAEQARTIRELVTLDDTDEDDDLMAIANVVAESHVVHPSLIGPLCEEFGREIDARLDAVTEEWSA